MGSRYIWGDGMSVNCKVDFDFEPEILEEASINSIKRVYDKKELSLVQVLDERNRIQKCLFYENGKRLSTACIYNANTGKEVKNITYRADGKNISSVREFDYETGRLLNVSFYKEDGKSLSSVIEYNEAGNEVLFSLYGDDGEVTTTKI